jgi:5-methylthioadenosine/S-adenosylhomocysteine deaminase
VASYARAERLPVAVHIAESEIEQELVTRAAGAFADGLRARQIAVAPRSSSPIQLLASLEVLGARPLLIHCVRVDARDIATIAAEQCSVAHCPASNAKLGHGIAPLSDLVAAGIAVGLGSDSMAGNNHMDLLEEARLAVLLQRARHLSPSEITPAAALHLATLGGAAALGLDGEIGSLEVGKAADLAAFPLRNLAPTFDVESAVIFALPGTEASLVTVAGRELVRDGQLLARDPELADRVQRVADALHSWRRANVPSPPESRARPLPA